MTTEKSGQTPTTHSPQLGSQAKLPTATPSLASKSTASMPLSAVLNSVVKVPLQYHVPHGRPLVDDTLPVNTTVPDIFSIDRSLSSPNPTDSTLDPSTSDLVYKSAMGTHTGDVSKYFRQAVSTSTPSPKKQPEVIIIEDTPTPPPSKSPAQPKTHTNKHTDIWSVSSSSVTSNSNKQQKAPLSQRPRDESDRLLKSLVDNSSIHKTYMMMAGAPANCTRSKRKRAELDYELDRNNMVFNINQATGGENTQANDAMTSTTTAATKTTKTIRKKRKTAEKKPRRQAVPPPSPPRRQRPTAKGKGKKTASGLPEKSKAKKTVPGVSQNVQNNAKAHGPCDDANGHLILKPNDLIADRFSILRLLGQGTFGRVVQCYDQQKKEYCAIKVGRAIPKFRKACLTEIEILQQLIKSDPHNEKGCVHLREHFEYKNHVCMVFDLLGDSLYDFMKKNDYRPFPMHHIQAFGRQLLNSVSHIHDLGLIHTDIKPENILIVDSTSKDGRHIYGQKQDDSIVLCNPEINLIDFGSAHYDSEHNLDIITTRHYRGPEVILKHGWSYPCDIWSLGCIFFELMTGEALFQTHEDLEHLAMMGRAIGDMPLPFVQKTTNRDAQKVFFMGKLDFPRSAKSKESIENVREVVNIETFMNPETEGERLFVDLVKRMLRYDPNDRITAREALNHPFFDVEYDQETGVELMDLDD